MKCQFCNGLIIHDPGDIINGPRNHCFYCGREPKSEIVMSNNLDSQKEEEVKVLLKDHSVREIVKKTGVAKNTIKRIRDESFTEEERAQLKKTANVKGRHKRMETKEVGISETSRPKKSDKKIIVSANRAVVKIDESMLQEKDSKWDFDGIAEKYKELLDQRQIEVEAEIKSLMAEHTRIQHRLCGLGEYFAITDKVDEEADETMEGEYIEILVDEWNEKSKKEKDQ